MSRQVVNPDTNIRFETLSYLPPLSPQSIARQVEYLLRKGWIPCIEFDKVGTISRINNSSPGYYDGRYWSLWKLPLFGCRSADEVLSEIEEAKRAYPNSYIRVGAFDNKKQVQCVSFIVYKPRK
jgi:ribulose-bisphosphate carboxylase small chain